MKKQFLIGFILFVITGLYSITGSAYNLVNSFYANDQTNFVVDYEDPFAMYSPGYAEEVTYDGYLALKELDLDGNGDTELLAIRIMDAGNGASMLIAEIYEVSAEQKLVCSTYYILAQDVMKYEKADCSVFLLNGKNGYYLCCENREEASSSTGDFLWELQVCVYKKEKLEQYQDLVYKGEKKLNKFRDSKNVSKACKTLGINVEKLVDDPIRDQGLIHLENVCKITRIIEGSTEELLEHMNSGDGAYYYGTTYFTNYANRELTNKILTQFPSRIADNVSTGYGYEQDGIVTSDPYSYPYDSLDQNGNVINDRRKQQTVTYEDPYLYGYTYNSNEFVFPDSDIRYLSESELWGLSAYQLRIARNEIYARHGRMFNDKTLQNYFSNTSWYHGTVPASAFTEEYARRVFDDVEIANIDLIKSYEDSINY